MGNRSAPPKLGRGGRPCKAIPDILLSHGRNPEQPKSSGSSVSLLAQPTPCSHSTGTPSPSKTFPFSLYLSSPFNSILESPFWPADGPSILPLISPESTYSQLCPELRGPLHHPLLEREASSASSWGRKQPPAPSASHTPMEPRPFSLGLQGGPSSVVGSMLQELWASWGADAPGCGPHPLPVPTSWLVALRAQML